MPGEEYVEGDVNTIDDAAGADVDEVETDYEEGDVNAVGGTSGDTDYEEGDVNAAPGGVVTGGAGNEADGGTSTSVLEYLARSLADEPDAVVVQVDERQGSVRFRLHVAPGDMGRVIGRRGRMAQAIRTLVGVAGARDGVQTSVDIVDD